MERLVKVIPTFLKYWELGEKKLCELETIFQVKFCIHLLVDMLIELNKLNQKFQRGHVYNTSIGTTLDVTIIMLRKRFLVGIFGFGAMHMSSFLIRAK